MFSSETALDLSTGVQADVFDHPLAIVPAVGLRALQKPSGADPTRLAGATPTAAVRVSLSGGVCDSACAARRSDPGYGLADAPDVPSAMTLLPTGGLAVVIGSSGTIGGALLERLRADGRFARSIGLSRGSDPPLDLLDEATIAAAAQSVAATGLDLRLVVDATGFLHGEGWSPEKTWRHLDPTALAHAFAVNAIGPALLIKHFAPLLPREGRAVFATLSARAGSIAENTVGGWYGYRASKAALNQIVRSAAAELGRTRRQALCVALHPGHVESRLSAPFGAGGQPTLSPGDAAERLLATIAGLAPADSGGFFDGEGRKVPW